jgi:prepilin-type N-terminal cleavage/methylation domain-containing protein
MTFRRSTCAGARTSRPRVAAVVSSSGGDVRAPQAGLTLLEMMVAVTLLALIMVGLLMMFNQTQKALAIANAQTDVFEHGRGAVHRLTRDLAEISSYGRTNVTNFYSTPIPSPIPGNGTLPIPGSPGYDLPVDFSEAFWLARVNDEWHGVGYFIDGTTFGVGTLMRFDRVNRLETAPLLQGEFEQGPITNFHRIAEGVVHFKLTAVWVTNTGPATNPIVASVQASNFQFPVLREEGTGFDRRLTVIELPAFVDLELGVLEPDALKQFESLTNDLSVAQNFLRNNVGRIHFFRERVPIRNFINPYRSHEVP